MEAAEAASVPTQTRVPVETQHVELQDDLQTVEKSRERRHKDATMAHAQTQTRKPKGEHKFTQTPVVFLCSQETQTDVHVAKPDDASEGKAQDGEKNAAESQPTEDKQGAPPRPQCDTSAQTRVTQSEDKKKSGDPTDSQGEEGAKPKSYAKVVSGDGAGERQSKMDASEAADKTMKPSQNLP